jgi:hypothetical protein
MLSDTAQNALDFVDAWPACRSGYVVVIMQYQPSSALRRFEHLTRRHAGSRPGSLSLDCPLERR